MLFFLRHNNRIYIFCIHFICSSNASKISNTSQTMRVTWPNKVIGWRLNAINSIRLTSDCCCVLFSSFCWKDDSLYVYCMCNFIFYLRSLLDFVGLVNLLITLFFSFYFVEIIHYMGGLIIFSINNIVLYYCNLLCQRTHTHSHKRGRELLKCLSVCTQVLKTSLLIGNLIE